MSETAEFLRARYAERRALAEAAKSGPWRSDGGSVYATHPTDEVVDYSESAPHIAANDPTAAIADLDAKLALLDDLVADRHFRLEEDNWYSCAALTDEDGETLCIDELRAGGPCDCGRDARVERRLRILAQPFATHPDHKGEEWAP